MMRFANPYFLLLLLLVPLLVWLRYFMARRRTVQFSNIHTLQGLPHTWRMRLQPLLSIVFAAGLASLVVALARPQQGLDESLIRTEAVDIVLLLDLSESMDTLDFQQNNRRISRLEASKDVIERFLDRRSDDRIGMVAFAAFPYAVAPLTLDHQWLSQRMRTLHTRMLDYRRTAIGDGIASAINRLNDSDAKSKVVILLTDGRQTDPTGLSPENAASLAEALEIKIYTIGAGGAYNGFGMRGNEVDEATLKKVAEMTNAKYFRAHDLETLAAVYEQIDQLEKTEIEVERYTRFNESCGGWIVAGIVLMGIEHLLGLTKLGRLP